MRKLVFLIMGLVVATSLDAQVLNRFRGTINVFGVSGSAPNYTITGFFNDQLGQYSSDSLSVGDYLYMSAGSECVRFEVTSIDSQTGGIITADVLDTEGVTAAFPSGVGAILAETPNNSYPGYISGISEDLLSCIRTHFTELVDISAGSGGGADSLTVQSSTTVSLAKTAPQELTASAIISGNPGNIVEALPTGLFADVQDNEITLNKQIVGAGVTNVASVLEVLADSMHVHKDGETIDFTLIQGVASETFDSVTAEVVVSGDAGNIIEARASGLYAGAAAAFEEFVDGDAVIRASSSSGVSFTKSGGVGTLSYPDDVIIFSVAIHGVSADLDGSNNFKVVLNNTGTTSVNAAASSMIPPTIQVVNTAAQLGGGPSDALPFVYDEGSSPQVQVVAVGGGDITARVINLDAFSNWTIVLNP